jgi:glycosyltransferase involved in cell wall biosynthesis
VANSHVVAQRLAKRGIVAPHRLHVIPNGIAISDFDNVSAHRSDVRRELGIGAAQVLWIAVGSLHEQKDHATLLRGFRELSRDSPEARLAIVGAGPRREELEAEIANLGLMEIVQMMGLRIDISRLLGGADGFVLSSAWE